MATQRLIVATVAGDAAVAVKSLMFSWHSNMSSQPVVVDRFCEQLRAHCAVLPVVYYCEWVDRWLMGDQIHGLDALAGKRFQIACVTPQQAQSWAGQCGSQFPEEGWLASRLSEGAQGWGPTTEPLVVLVLREVLGASTTDDEIYAALHGIPDWLVQ